MEQVINVGLGELVVSDALDSVLVAYGLGSCVGISAYDPALQAGGLLHAMLPRRRNGDRNVSKFVDTGVPEMLKRLDALGASRERLVWRVAGGAQMLTVPGLSDRFNIGQRNITMVQEMAARYGLHVVGQDVGGVQGRTVRLVLATGDFVIRYVTGEMKWL